MEIKIIYNLESDYNQVKLGIIGVGNQINLYNKELYLLL